MKLRILIFLISFHLINVCQAQYSGGSLSTDRPGFTFTPFTVGKNIFQTETGMLYRNQTVTSDSRNRDVLLFNYFRYGITEPFEVMWGFGIADSWITASEGNIDTDPLGINTFELAIRYNILATEKGAGIGILFNVSLNPIKTSEYKGDKTSPTVLLLYAVPVYKSFSLNGNIGMNWNLEDSQETFTYTLVGGFGIYKQLSGYVEWYGFVANSMLNDGFDGGLAYLFNNNLQTDLHAGYRSFEGQNEFFVSAGVAFRFGKRVKIN